MIYIRALDINYKHMSIVVYRLQYTRNIDIRKTSETDNSMTARHSDRLYYTRRPQRFTLIFKKNSKCDSNIQKDLGVILKCHRSTALYREFN